MTGALAAVESPVTSLKTGAVVGPTTCNFAVGAVIPMPTTEL